MFHDHLDSFQKNHLLEEGLTQDRETLGTPNAHNRWTRINKNQLKQPLAEGPVTYGFTLHLRVHDHTTRVWRCFGTAFGHFLRALTIKWSRLLARV